MNGLTDSENGLRNALVNLIMLTHDENFPALIAVKKTGCIYTAWRILWLWYLESGNKCPKRNFLIPPPFHYEIELQILHFSHAPQGWPSA